MEQISLQLMTRELCHQIYKKWENDDSIYMDMGLFKTYIYDEEKVDKYEDQLGTYLMKINSSQLSNIWIFLKVELNQQKYSSLILKYVI